MLSDDCPPGVSAVGDLGKRPDSARQPSGFIPDDSLTAWLLPGKDGVERRAWLLVPGNVEGQLPVVLAPHPFGLTAIGNLFGESGGHRTLVDIPGIAPAARRHGFAVLALSAEGARLSGVSLGWPAHLEAYLSALDMAIEAGAPLDSSAVGAAGLSMGGQEAILLGCHYPGTVKAVAVQSPITDLQAWHRHLAATPGGSVHAAAILRELGSDSGAWAERSPLSQLSSTGKLRLHLRLNDLDSLVPARDQGRPYAAALQAHGVNVDLVEDLPPIVDGRDPGRAAHEHVNWDALLTWLAAELTRQAKA